MEPGQQRQFGRREPGQWQGGAGAGAGMSGNVEQLRMQRREHVEAGGRRVIEEPGRRFIVRENGRAFIRHDENERFRRWGAPRIEQRGHEHYSYISRPGGYHIVTVTDRDGRLLRRLRRGPDGREIVIIDNRVRHRPGVGVGVGIGLGVGLAAGVALGLAAPVITIPRERYIVDVSAAPPPLLYETLEAPPVVDIERAYSLDEIRYNTALRDRMRRIDIDSITFDSGSWEVVPEQEGQLEAVAEAIRRVLDRNPNEVFMIEGHTDAVGSEDDNLSLSDRRAESVAVILTETYQIPPENLVTQGYGEQVLKVSVEGPSRENRRCTVRRITPLLNGQVASR
jgi:outer membrane protein OmpA-like peptidoglycan-associated protein